MIGWEMLWPLGTLLLGLGIAYGMWRVHTRNKANDAVTEAATREQYDNPKTYMAETRDELKDEIRPS